MITEERDTEQEQEEQEHEEEEQEQSSGIRFEFDRLEHRGETQTSLTDLYGYPVFSEVFARQVSQFQERQTQELEELFRRVFIGEPVHDLTAIFVAVMEAEPQMIIRVDPPSPVTRDSPFLMLGFTTLGMFLTVMLLVLMERIKSKRRQGL